MGNKSSRVNSPPYAYPSPKYARPSPYGRPSGSLCSASAISQTGNPNYGAPSPAERGMMYCKTKNATVGPTPSVLYGKKSRRNSPAPTPTNLYSKPSVASTPTPTPLYTKQSKGLIHQGFSRSSIVRSGVSSSGASIGHLSPYAMSGTLAESYSRSSVVDFDGTSGQMPMTLCVKCRIPFKDTTTAFCRDCGSARPVGTTIPIAMAAQCTGRSTINF